MDILERVATFGKKHDLQGTKKRSKSKKRNKSRSRSRSRSRSNSRSRSASGRRRKNKWSVFLSKKKQDGTFTTIKDAAAEYKTLKK